MKAYSVDEISQIVGGMLTKVNDVQIEKLMPPHKADEKSLALGLSEEAIEALYHTKAKAALVPLGVNIEGLTTIEVERPRLAMMKLMTLFEIPVDKPKGIHPTAIIDETAKLGENVSIGANVYISRDVEIADGTSIMAGCYIGKGTKIGEKCLFHPNCNIGDFATIGNRVVLQHGVSIAADGFSFVTETPDTIEQAREGKEASDEKKANQKIYKIPSLGSVTIEDDVEIGANTCIDRGTIEDTVIGAQTKIDNLVQIGHNCKIGRGCMIVSQVGIAGSCEIGDRVVIAGQAGLADHIKIASDSIIMAQAGVTKSFSSRAIIMGAPAVPRKDFIKQHKTMADALALIEKYKKYEYLLETLEQGEEEFSK